MTSLCQVLVVLHGEWTKPTTDQVDDSRAIEQVDRFARELAESGLLSVRVMSLEDLAANHGSNENALLLVFDEPGAASALARALKQPLEAVERRTFALAARRRSEVIAALERSGGPGCVESYRLFVWQTESPDNDPPGGVFGRKDVARSIGARWQSPALWESEHYAMLSHEAYPTLPRLVAAYLAGFWAAERTVR